LRTYVASGSVASGSSSQFGGVHHAQQQTPGQTSQSKWEEPYFDDTTPRNVTGLVGKSAYLSCRVKNLGNKTVSWIRHRDIHILTVGSYTYTSDQRFQATHHKDVDDWTLQIKWAQKRDAGIYECQISTQPVRSYFVTLSVVGKWTLTKNLMFFSTNFDKHGKGWWNQVDTKHQSHYFFKSAGQG
uniref:Ig-like domain-containing protein n=1 Tax=Anopheles coluzzii TaxID=1518534 RepID=A0A8W7Q2K3_ANOCL